ncbi:SDR family NAD(P)-dependent oxidoreductase [Paracoccus laeviglucosivorans]|uniref:Gluconate 5-dehydrogenase/2-deoxy-D-gluconate 3-dehydrogenase n=1 Tax=Paracoccus laeviglucosivorans TaxID=1197861 RepID=A0A521FMY4_9RHOB|nr:SDR family oxidoreductase [Paracoccus laeviglucosivorans]SMO97522.1 gluconate 5-dehydrogenase/2-deoxy-D-gluconate 3-dehydrogenase [Paracoccus laeviglucosivorans]
MEQHLFSVEGKIACVTGASSGLGRQAALTLSHRGAKVIAIARREAELAALASQGQGLIHPIAADLTDQAALAGLARQAAAAFGAPDILINAAGVNTREHADNVTPQGWDITLALNLSTPFFLAQALVPAMKEKRWGRIINFASLQSYRAFTAGISYGASKGGVAQMTRAMAEAWSPMGITANAVGPGFFRTELTAAVFADEALAAKNAAQTCIGRNGEPSDMDGPLLFLCSSASDYVTGQILMVDGGFTAK